MNQRPVLIMAGGTGGHVFPALAVAKVLQVQPKLVYRWMAGLERPSFTDVNTSKQRLEQAFRTPKPSFPHARRRAFDPHLVPVPLAAAA